MSPAVAKVGEGIRILDIHVGNENLAPEILIHEKNVNVTHKGDTVEVPLGDDRFAVLDADDYPAVAPYAWQYYLRPNRDIAYACAQHKGKPLRMHRLILGLEPGDLCDHIDGDGLNNRRENLRRCTYSQNNANRRAWGKVPYKGVCEIAGGRYKAYIVQHKRQQHLGTHDTPEEAARAYDAAALKLHGDFARLNFGGAACA